MADNSAGRSALDNSNNVFVVKLVGQSDTLRLMLYGLAVDNSNLELFENGFVDLLTLR